MNVSPELLGAALAARRVSTARGVAKVAGRMGVEPATLLGYLDGSRRLSPEMERRGLLALHLPPTWRPPAPSK